MASCLNKILTKVITKPKKSDESCPMEVALVEEMKTFFYSFNTVILYI